MNDPFDLGRFVNAQERRHESVIQELRRGKKIGHWMWYVFPQVVGLGFSGMAQRYAISSRAEAIVYTEHPVLGPRLRECTQLVIDVSGRTANDIFGEIDAMKFRSCMTLFENAAADNEIFRRALDRYYDGEPDQLTIDILRSHDT